MCADCLTSYTLTKCLCSFCTEIDISTLRYTARHKGLTISIFNGHNAPATAQLGLLLDLLVFWLGPADPTYCSCSSSWLAAYKPNENFKMQLYIF